MGLDTSHGCWHGAYSVFTRWRHELARAAGYQVARLEGHIHDTTLIDWGHIVDKNYYGDWDVLPTDPLILLIAHSDCEGVIHQAHAALLADRLTELLPLLDGDGGGHIGDYRTKTQQFIDGLRDAVAKGEDIEFHCDG